MRAGVLALLLVTLGWASPAALARAEEPSLASLRGEITIVAFWASWCPPCLEELPRLEALQQKLGDGKVRLVAVNVDTRAKRAAAQAVFAEHKMTIPLVLGGRALYERYFRRPELVVPRMVVIDRQGHGLKSDGFAPDVTTDAFIRDILAAVARVRSGGGGRAPLPEGWLPLR